MIRTKYVKKTNIIIFIGWIMYNTRSPLAILKLYHTKNNRKIHTISGNKISLIIKLYAKIDIGIKNNSGEPDQLIIEYICLNFLFSFENIVIIFIRTTKRICKKERKIRIRKKIFHGDSTIDKNNNL